MRLRPFLLAVFAFAAMMHAPAEAIEYPWCSNFADGAGENCGFTSYEQCMLTARGAGGFCAENSFYRPPAAKARSPRATRNRRPAKKE